jgi:hypothetical protein
MNKSQTISVIAITIFAAILLVGPIASDAGAHNKKHKESSYENGNKKDNSKDKEDSKNNIASQEIPQVQFSEQFSKCISGVATALSCNNVDLQAAATIGNNAIGQ